MKATSSEVSSKMIIVQITAGVTVLDVFHVNKRSAKNAELT